MIDELAAGVIDGNRRALGKAITLVESRNYEHRIQASKLMDKIMPKTGNSIRLGISGTPGVGKSTFIESAGKEILGKGYKLAVLAVDPSSPRSKGSILGDKTRMQYLSAHKDTFIRPSPAGRELGGVASRTREAILLCEAAGYDFILVETVGVGQSEYVVNSMVDLFVYLQLPNAGDQLQAIKKGILEVANVILINKSDGKNIQSARRAKADLDLALNLIYQNDHESKPQVSLISSLEETGIDQFVTEVLKSIELRRNDNRFITARKEQAAEWYAEEVKRLFLDRIFEDEDVKAKYQSLIDRVRNLKLSPKQAALRFVQYREKMRDLR